LGRAAAVIVEAARCSTVAQSPVFRADYAVLSESGAEWLVRDRYRFCAQAAAIYFF